MKSNVKTRQINTRSTRNTPPSTDSAGNSASSSPTFLNSPSENGKHPLNSAWTLWYYSNNPNKEWEENLNEVVTFDTVEDFWAVYNHILLASELREKCDYALFKRGIKPMWEDRANCKGGRWLCNFDANKRFRSANNPGIDIYWMEILMCLVGEAFGEECGKLVNGAVIAVRARADKIGLWMSDSSNQNAIMAVGGIVKERFNLEQQTIIFEAHEDTAKKSSSTVRRRYQI